MLIMTEYTSSENVSTTIFFNLFLSTHCPSYSNKIKYFFMLQYQITVNRLNTVK